MNRRVLVARLDSVGDVVLTGPAVRAVAHGAHSVTFLAGPVGARAAALLPGIDEVVTWAAPWVTETAAPVRRAHIDELVSAIAERGIDEAAIFTSFHQSPLPLALVLRRAGVERIAATSVDHPGSLLDARVSYDQDLHEVEQNLQVVAALGYRPAPGDDGRLHVRTSCPMRSPWPEPYVVVHPRASVPARGLAPTLADGVVGALWRSGHRVLVTGSSSDAAHTEALAAGRPGVEDLSGRTDLEEMTAVLMGAEALVVGNTGPAHLAAAVGTPVVSVFAPVVDPRRWAPWRVPHRMLGRLDIDCAGCRSRSCPLEGQPCTSRVSPSDVLAALGDMAPALSAPSRPCLAGGSS